MYTEPEDKTTGRILLVTFIAFLAWTMYCLTLL